jgi:hypothetical protein
MAGISPLPLIERRQLLERLTSRAKVGLPTPGGRIHGRPEAFEAAGRRRLQGIVSKRKTASYRFEECDDWVQVTTVAWRETNRERWRLFERNKAVALGIWGLGDVDEPFQVTNQSCGYC